MTAADNSAKKLNKSDKFTIFASCYCLALWLEMAENWESPWFTAIGLLLLLLTTIKINLAKFCGFVGFTTAYFLAVHFPEVANHVNLIVFINLVILITAVYYWLNRDRFANFTDFEQTLASPLRISLVAVYFWAGFHKLNTDFLNPYFSCSNSMFMGIVEVLNSTVFGIPTWLILGLITGVFIKNIIAQNIVNSIFNWVKTHRQQLTINLAAFVILIAIAIAGIVYLQASRQIFPLFVIATSIFVLAWELVGGIAMLFPRWQVLMFCLSIFMHLVLAPVGFVDFGSLAFALWLTFIPTNYYPALQQKIALPNNQTSKIRISPLWLFLLINIINGLISGLFYLTPIEFNIKAISGILLVISILIWLTPLIRQLIAQPQTWQGVKVIDTKIPWLTYGAIAILTFYAATSYLGLRTAGNFSMFSNLRTEGISSNHLLLSNNPLKIWNYQEDTVKVIAIDDQKAKIGHKYRPLKDHYLPVVEFKKLIYKWTKADYTVPITFEYGDRLYQTNNIVQDPTWQTPKRTWEMILFDFRIIQADNSEPNYCRW